MIAFTRASLPDRTADANVAGMLAMGRNGPRATLGNVLIVLRNDPRWRGRLRLNLLGQRIEFDGQELPEGYGISCIQEWIENTYSFAPRAETIAAAVYAMASENAYFPPREWIEGLSWDGEQRIHRVLTEVLGCADDPLHQKFIRRFFISCVARVMNPGCKVDTALILVGPTGARKSTFFGTWFAPWFTDSTLPLGNKDAFLQLARVIGYEMSELDSVRKVSAEAVKQFLSSPSDTYRAPYARVATQHPRHTVICGTTNDDQFLTDPSGSRRFWPLAVPDDRRIDLPLLRELREHLWVEALHAFRAGERWWFELDEDVEREKAAADFYLDDARAARVRDYVENREWVTSDAIYEHALGISVDRWTKTLANDVGGIMRRAGWKQRAVRIGAKVQRAWVPRYATVLQFPVPEGKPGF